MQMHYILTVSRNIEPLENDMPITRADTYVGTTDVQHPDTEAELLQEIFAHRVGIPLSEASNHTITFWRLVPNAIVTE